MSSGSEKKTKELVGSNDILDSKEIVSKLLRDFDGIVKSPKLEGLSAVGRKRISDHLEDSAAKLAELVIQVDPVRRPQSLFDPGNPRTIGFFVALALTSQPRRPLSLIEDFYGAGVYAIYYKGNFKSYAPLKKTETPIYVGQAISVEGARTPREQGRRLAARLNEHRKNILRASKSLDIKDFDYRALAVQTGWETAAEDYLIRLFRPIWNKQVKILFGFGKHGDSAETRRNRRSPWDTLHSGRGWAKKSEADAKSPKEIDASLKKHFLTVKPYKNYEQLLSEFIFFLRQ